MKNVLIAKQGYLVEMKNKLDYVPHVELRFKEVKP